MYRILSSSPSDTPRLLLQMPMALRCGRSELSVFVRALNFGARWFPNIDYSRFANLMVNVSQLLFWAGTDEGGMNVSMRGLGLDGQQHEVVWTLFAGSGHGPQTPCTPAVILAERAVAGLLRTGARACVSEITEAELQAATAGRGYNFLFHVQRRGAQRAGDQLEAAFSADVEERLPELVRRFYCPRPHEPPVHVTGRVTVRRLDGVIPKILATLGGLPPPMKDAKLVMANRQEKWTRMFGNVPFDSGLCLKDGLLHEWFRTPLGLIVRIGVHWTPDKDGQGFLISGKKMWFAGIPLPHWLKITPEGYVRANPNKPGWRIAVKTFVPLIGPILEYEADIDGEVGGHH
eukprot:TRINITY_DN4763_c0_g1_i1.p1 TRINITY_DN4763_c0_g1~~TRINITY_DN4763_c0_g1_i1.p1  ORF type:complete len:347 (-),score=42.52 TRINITY_DN4763_c0_g1_i1:2-1042(-)